MTFVYERYQGAITREWLHRWRCSSCGRVSVGLISRAASERTSWLHARYCEGVS